MSHLLKNALFHPSFCLAMLLIFCTSCGHVYDEFDDESEEETSTQTNEGNVRVEFRSPSSDDPPSVEWRIGNNPLFKNDKQFIVEIPTFFEEENSETSQTAAQFSVTPPSDGEFELFVTDTWGDVYCDADHCYGPLVITGTTYISACDEEGAFFYQTTLCSANETSCFSDQYVFFFRGEQKHLLLTSTSPDEEGMYQSWLAFGSSSSTGTYIFCVAYEGTDISQEGEEECIFLRQEEEPITYMSVKLFQDSFYVAWIKTPDGTWYRADDIIDSH